MKQNEEMKQNAVKQNAVGTVTRIREPKFSIFMINLRIQLKRLKIYTWTKLTLALPMMVLSLRSDIKFFLAKKKQNKLGKIFFGFFFKFFES